MARNQTPELAVLVPEVGGCLHPDVRKGTADFTIRVPWYQTFVMAVAGPFQNLSTGQTIYRYSSALKDAVELWAIGVNLEAADDDIVSAFFDVSEPTVMVPFFSAPISALAGNQSQTEPLLYLAQPYLLMPGAELQFMAQNTSATDTKSRIYVTLAGVRLIRHCVAARVSSR